jgi:hypothetical protein
MSSESNQICREIRTGVVVLAILVISLWGISLAYLDYLKDEAVASIRAAQESGGEW